MTDAKHRTDTDGRVIEAALHPEGSDINPNEYYMVDPPSGSDTLFLAHRGQTHVVYYTASFEGDTRIDCHALESWQQVDRFLTDSFRSGSMVASSPKQLIADLRKKADKLEQWLEKNPQPAKTEFQGMPYAGMKVWVEHPGKPGIIVHIKVVGAYVSGKEVCVATEGWKYFRPGQWFWTKEAAEASFQKV